MSQPSKKLLKPIYQIEFREVWVVRLGTRAQPIIPRSSMNLLKSESSIEHFDIERMSHSP